MIRSADLTVNFPAVGAILAILAGFGINSTVAQNDDDVAVDIHSSLLLKLEAIDETKKTLSDYKHDFLVICFTSNTCPYSVDYEKRLKAMQAKFIQNMQSAVLVAINSNDHKDDTLEEMAERSKEQSFNFDYLKDSDQKVAKAFDAVYTPEFFVLNKAREIIYQGAMDDATKEKEVTINYVTRAITAVQSGKKPEAKKTGARGCRIRYQRRRKKKAP